MSEANDFKLLSCVVAIEINEREPTEKILLAATAKCC